MRRSDIVCISMTTWEGDHMKTIVQLVNELSKNHRVLFVEYPFTHKDLLMGMVGTYDIPVRRLLGMTRRLDLVNNRHKPVFRLTLPPLLPTNWIADFNKFKEQIFVQSERIQEVILNTMRELEIHRPVVLNAFNPIFGLPLVDQLNESGTLYYCPDEINTTDWSGKHGGKMEQEFMKKVDAVIVNSEHLYQKKIKHQPNTYLIEDGVSFGLFNSAMNPFRFNKKERKVIGYVGSVDFRLDYDLLSNVIQLNPDYNFQFVGRIIDNHGYNQLKSFDNVTFFGAKSPEELPKLMKEMDLGIVPFSINDINRNIAPVKIGEYMAAGLPVVTTAFTELNDMDKLVSVAYSTDDFIDQIKKEIREDSLTASYERIFYAKQQDWSQITGDVESLIRQQISVFA